MMSRQASAEREKRATITKAEGDKEARSTWPPRRGHDGRAAPERCSSAPSRRSTGWAPTASNTVVLAVPVEVLELAKMLARPKTGP